MTSNNSESKADKLATEGMTQIKAGDYDHAIQSLLESADLYSKEENFKAQAKQLLITAEIYQMTDAADHTDVHWTSHRAASFLPRPACGER